MNSMGTDALSVRNIDLSQWQVSLTCFSDTKERGKESIDLSVTIPKDGDMSVSMVNRAALERAKEIIETILRPR